MRPSPRLGRTRARFLAVLVTIAVVVTWAVGGAFAAADAESRAGLVLQFGDGTVRTYCVGLGGAEITGLELLRLAGVETRSESTALGTKVCRMEGEGCGDGEDCWCRCQTLGADCTYWAYHVLDDGRWRYSTRGAAARTVRHGDVDGWAWGPGTLSSGAQPPVRSFEDLCPVDSTATASPSVPPGTGTPESPTAPPPGGTPSTEQPPRPTRTPTRRAERPSRTPRLSGTPHVPSTSRPTDTALPTSTPVPTEDALSPALRATSDAHMATLVALAMGQEGVGGDGAPPDATVEPAAMASHATPVGAVTRTPTPGSVAGQVTPPVDADVALGDGRRRGLGYLAFALVTAALGGVLLWLRRA